MSPIYSRRNDKRYNQWLALLVRLSLCPADGSHHMLSYYCFGCWIPRGSGIGHGDELELRLALRPGRFVWIASRTDCFIHDASVFIFLGSHDNLEDDKWLE